MGQILRARARTTEEVRREIQHSKESLKVLSQRYGVNFKTILKWKHRDYVHESPMGAKILILQHLVARKKRSARHFASIRCCCKTNLGLSFQLSLIP